MVRVNTDTIRSKRWTDYAADSQKTVDWLDGSIQLQRISVPEEPVLKCVFFAVRPAGGGHGGGAEKQRGGFCQPVAGGGADRAGVSVHTGERHTAGCRSQGRLSFR